MARLIGLLCILASLAAPAAAQTPDTRALWQSYRCSLSTYLAAVFERPAYADPARQFTRISINGWPEGYVRCAFRDREIFCEASILQGRSISERAPLPHDAVTALQRLGFEIQQGASLTYRHAFSGNPDFSAVATLMLTGLHDAYGARDGADIQIEAPFAGSMVAACMR